MKNKGLVRVMAIMLAITAYRCVKTAYECGQADERDWFLNEADITGPDGKKWRLKID